MSSDKNDSIPEFNRKHLLGGVFSILFLYLVLSKTVYDCSQVKSEVIQAAYQSCLSTQVEKKQISAQLELEKEKIELEKEKAYIQHCENVLKEGKLCTAKDNLAFSKSEMTMGCDSEIKPLVCEPKNFLWKLWYL